MSAAVGTAVARRDVGARRRRTNTHEGTLDREALDVMVVQQWTKMLKDPYDWAEWPLARYMLGDDLVGAVQGTGSEAAGCRHPEAVRLAWVCAMVACGRAPRLRSLDPSPLFNPSSGEPEQLVRADGARAWRCNVRRNAPDGLQLRYWTHPSGLVEFDAICCREELCPA